VNRILLLCVVVFASWASAAEPAKVRVLLIDGQNNHNWKATTPVLKKYLDDAGRFETTIATAPAKPGKDGNQDEYKKLMAAFKPDLAKVDVIVSNYNGDSWSKEFNDDLDAKLKDGKVGLVIVHAANNAFGGWKEWNQMIGLGWRDKSYGKRLKLTDDGKEVIVEAGKDNSTSHKYTGDFPITIRDKEHPVTKGMPIEWMHHRDELYDNLRGPAENIKVLATAFAPKGKGTDVHEPMVFTIDYGKGRVFHTPMGHDANAMRCVGFASTIQRGTEWAATGKVTIELPKNFPTAEKSSLNPETK
jgi:uncharacterized protein